VASSRVLDCPGMRAITSMADEETMEALGVDGVPDAADTVADFPVIYRSGILRWMRLRKV